jgi:DNA repair protein RadD
VRAEIIKRFRSRQILQLVNVDLFGEGFDLPAIEVVSMARRTMSYSLYCQQFGRALRILADNPDKIAIIIDHAGNVKLHGLPDKDRDWSLADSGSGPKYKDPDDEIPLRYCTECTQPYEVIHKACPWCGHVLIPADRSKPEYVDGDLHELSPEALALMRGEVERVDQDPNEVARRMQYAGAPDIAVASALKNNKIRQVHQSALRESIGWFAHIQTQRGVPQSESYRRFYHTFGIDVLSAQALGKPQAIELADKLNQWIGRNYA